MSPAPEETCTVSQNVPSGLTVSISQILVTLHQGTFLEYLVCFTSLMSSLWSTEDRLEYYVNVTQAVREISLLMHQDPLLVNCSPPDVFNHILQYVDFMTWKRFPHYWPFVTSGFPSQRPLMRTLDVSFVVRLCRLFNSRGNIEVAGDLKHQGAHVSLV